MMQLGTPRPTHLQTAYYATTHAHLPSFLLAIKAVKPRLADVQQCDSLAAVVLQLRYPHGCAL
jgi:hypothetical protein